ncbi:MAG: GntR family transcriptional regulator [Proteobacteria bacterium]|nr:GntR family transcriptional regulator [Pseudomonadota bacterium]MBS0573314.1 GntR family transcriptional regulator [Pseudomonadota bacterium]
MYQGREAVSGPVAEICERIWLSIAEKRLRPGAHLKEEELSEIFDLSRARVRQALSLLESDGLVTILPNRGAFVAQPTIEEARDVFLFRKQLEARVIERVVERITEDGIRQLEAHLAEERAAHDRGDTSAAVQLAGGFHLVLADLAGSDFLASMVRILVSRSTLITSMYRVRHLNNCAPEDHEGLINAIRARAPGPAQAAMREHIDHVEAELDLGEATPVARDLRQALG